MNFFSTKFALRTFRACKMRKTWYQVWRVPADLWIMVSIHRNKVNLPGIFVFSPLVTITLILFSWKSAAEKGKINENCVSEKKIKQNAQRDRQNSSFTRNNFDLLWPWNVVYCVEVRQHALCYFTLVNRTSVGLSIWSLKLELPWITS